VTGPAPDPGAPWWTTTDVARYLGVHIGTVSSYRQRHQMPAPIGKVGSSHIWHPRAIVAWADDRPRSKRAAKEAS